MHLFQKWCLYSFSLILYPISAHPHIITSPTISQSTNPHHMASGDIVQVAPNTNISRMFLAKVLHMELFAIRMACNRDEEMLMAENRTPIIRNILVTWIMSALMAMEPSL